MSVDELRKKAQKFVNHENETVEAAIIGFGKEDDPMGFTGENESRVVVQDADDVRLRKMDVVEVEITGETDDGNVRFGEFIRLTDRSPNAKSEDAGLEYVEIGREAMMERLIDEIPPFGEDDIEEYNGMQQIKNTGVSKIIAHLELAHRED